MHATPSPCANALMMHCIALAPYAQPSKCCGEPRERLERLGISKVAAGVHCTHAPCKPGLKNGACSTAPQLNKRRKLTTLRNITFETCCL
eukprot:6204112-Pleurochrysis_carterae.AAC.4